MSVERVQRGWVADDCCGHDCSWEGEKLYVRWSFCCCPLLIWSLDPFHDGMNICYTGNRPFCPLKTKSGETFNSRYTLSFCPVDENLVSQQFFRRIVNFSTKTDSVGRGNSITQSTSRTRQSATNFNYPRQRAKPHSANTNMSKYTAQNTWMPLTLEQVQAQGHSSSPKTSGHAATSGVNEPAISKWTRYKPDACSKRGSTAAKLLRCYGLMMNELPIPYLITALFHFPLLNWITTWYTTS